MKHASQCPDPRTHIPPGEKGTRPKPITGPGSSRVLSSPCRRNSKLKTNFVGKEPDGTNWKRSDPFSNAYEHSVGGGTLWAGFEPATTDSEAVNLLNLIHGALLHEKRDLSVCEL